MWMDGSGEGGDSASGPLGNILVGGIDGRLFVQSTSKRDIESVTVGLDRRITKIIPCPQNRNIAAVCGQQETVKVFSLETGTVREIYSNSSHSDIVRDVLWMSDKRIVTCSWDSKIIEHCFSSS